MTFEFIHPLEPRRLMCDFDAIALVAAEPSARNFAIVAAHNSVPAAISRASLPAQSFPEPEPETTLNWQTRQQMPQRREEGGSAALNGKLYVFGGFYDSTFNPTGRVDAYDPSTNTWSQKRSMTEAITHAPTLVIDNEAWMFGGYVGLSPGPATRHVYIYNPVSNAWRRGPDLPTERGAAGAAMVGRTVYLFGGRDRDRLADQSTVYSLNLDTGVWSTRASLPNPRNHVAAAAVDGFVYAIGGQINQAPLNYDVSDVHRYNPATDTWTRVASLPIDVSHQGASTFVYNGQIVVAGGEVAHNVSTGAVLAYRPSTNQWRPLGDLPAARRSPQAAIIGGRIYLAGGALAGAQKPDLYVSDLLSDVI